MKKHLFTALICCASMAFAENSPKPYSTDARIQYVNYTENNVVPIEGRAFITTHIQFGDKEEILDIEGGDTAAWMVTFHPTLANTVFVKPTLPHSNTNLTIITNKHSYYFNLKSKRDASNAPTYGLHFKYPETKTAKPLAVIPRKLKPSSPKVYNTAYRFSGSPELLPKHVFDDGTFTYFELSHQGAVPAVFAVDDKSGKESTVNIRRENKYLVVQRIAPQFTLRQGRLATSVFNTQEITRIAQNKRPS